MTLIDRYSQNDFVSHSQAMCDGFHEGVSDLLALDTRFIATFGTVIGVELEGTCIRLSQFGSYYGAVPKKLPNGRWVFPDGNAIEIIKRKGKAR